MKISNNLKQGSTEWLRFRGTGLGASDFPIIMGDSPWKSRFELWLNKTGLAQSPSANEFQMRAMLRGTMLEPKIRELYEFQLEAKFPPINIQSEAYPFLRASLDGYNAELSRVFEAKAPGKVDMQIAMSGDYPDKYKAQVQGQLMISQADSLDYVSYSGDGDIIIVNVKSDVPYQEKLLQELIAFWNLVQTKVPPEVSAKDLSKLKEQLESAQLAVQNIQLALSLAPVIMNQDLERVTETKKLIKKGAKNGK